MWNATLKFGGNGGTADEYYIKQRRFVAGKKFVMIKNFAMEATI